MHCRKPKRYCQHAITLSSLANVHLSSAISVCHKTNLLLTKVRNRVMLPDAAPGAMFELLNGYIERAWNNNLDWLSFALEERNIVTL